MMIFSLSFLKFSQSDCCLPETLLTAIRIAPAAFMRSTTGASQEPFTPFLAGKGEKQFLFQFLKPVFRIQIQGSSGSGTWGLKKDQKC